MLKEKFLQEYASLQTQIQHVQNELKNLPTGTLIISHDGKSQKWYVSDGHRKAYIPKKNQLLAEQLAQKKYLSAKLEALTHEKEAIDAYLKIRSKGLVYVEDEILSDKGLAQLLSSYFKPKDEQLQQWKTENFERNLNYPEHLIHKASSGIMVRSKSEAMIERFLYTHGISFRYECALHLENMVFYPDFTILHPETKSLYYWEHFGRMDDTSYAEKTFSKLRTYTAYGIIPSIQLITTYETQRHPLSYEDVDKIGTLYFLS